VSVIGIAVITAALVILVAAFNGIEGMVEKLYSEYDAAITVRSSKGKTFQENTIDLKALRKMEGVLHVNRAIEETVILKHQKKWVNAHMVGVDFDYLTDCNMEKHIIEGYPDLEENGNPTSIIGAALLDKLDGYISQLDGNEELLLYTPLREASIGKRKSPFKITPLQVVGLMNYNREVNANEVLVPFAFAQQQLNYDGDVTALYISVKGDDPFEVKNRIQTLLGENFVVKTAAEKNELIFKTSQSEKRIVIIILVFVFILAAFNLVASLMMLYLEKKENIQTMYRIGANQQFIFRIFFFEGLLIAAKGIVIGLVLGTAVCLLQLKFAVLEMPNSGGAAFPIEFTLGDGVLILTLVCGLSLITSYIPVWYLVKKSGHES
jgi:lipoprotein-releasing system permease protein